MFSLFSLSFVDLSCVLGTKDVCLQVLIYRRGGRRRGERVWAWARIVYFPSAIFYPQG